MQNIRHLFFYFFLLIVFNGCGPKTPQVIPPVATQPQPDEIYLKDLCDQNRIFWEWDSISQVVTLKLADAKATALVGSDVVMLGAEQITLSAPLTTVKSLIVVPSDFKRRVIEPLLKKGSERADYNIKKVRGVVIDAGHGGKDPGALAKSGLQEKKVVLDVCKRLASYLRERNIKVIMTREKDVFISLKERTVMASRSKADLFISIHANASGSKSAQGIEVFSLRDLTEAEKKDADRQENYATMFKHFDMKFSNRDLENILEDMLYSYKQGQSGLLATIVSEKVSNRALVKNRGVKESRFYVLRNTHIPAILIELGFLTNPKEESLMKTAEYRQKLAEGIGQSIISYMNR